jgi:hypothetical protein
VELIEALERGDVSLTASFEQFRLVVPRIARRIGFEQVSLLRSRLISRTIFQRPANAHLFSTSAPS